jgi:hypothetical protein
MIDPKFHYRKAMVNSFLILETSCSDCKHATGHNFLISCQMHKYKNGKAHTVSWLKTCDLAEERKCQE